jgi:hypothetical protein
MNTTEARIAFVNAREAFRVAVLEVTRCEKRLAVLHKHDTARTWVSLAHEEWRASIAEAEKCSKALDEAKQMLAVAEEFKTLDAIHNLNVRFERWSAKVERFFSRDL